MSFWVYMLRCADGSYYTGHTDDLERRIAQHGAGEGGAYTRERLPVTLVFADWCDSRDDAFRRERQVKNWSRAKKEALVASNWPQLCRLAVPPCEREARLSSDVAPDTPPVRHSL